MGAFRPTGFAGDLERRIFPGDLMVGGENFATLTTAGAGTWTAAMIASGLLTRTGPGAGYTDTTDTADAILKALAGTNPGPDAIPGSTFRFTLINTVAFLLTLAAGRGVTLGANGSNVVNVAASLVREYLFTILNNTPEFTIPCATTNAQLGVTFVLPPNMVSLPMGQADNPQGITVTPGMVVTGTGIAANTTVAGVTQGQGGVTGVTLSQNATATNNPVALTFSPNIRIDGVRSSTL